MRTVLLLDDTSHLIVDDFNRTRNRQEMACLISLCFTSEDLVSWQNDQPSYCFHYHTQPCLLLVRLKSFAFLRYGVCAIRTDKFSSLEISTGKHFCCETQQTPIFSDVLLSDHQSSAVRQLSSTLRITFDLRRLVGKITGRNGLYGRLFKARV